MDMILRCQYCKTSTAGELGWKLHLCGRTHQELVVKLNFEKHKIHRSIFVTGFTVDTSNEDIYDYFSRFGLVNNIVFHEKRNRFCFVEFSDINVVNEVTATKHRLKRRYIIVDRRSNTGYNVNDDIHLRIQEVLNNLYVLLPLPVQVEVLVQELALTMQEIKERKKLVKIICSYLSSRYPGCAVSAFGSSVSSLGFPGCDLDIFVNLGVDNRTDADRVRVTANIFKEQKSIDRISEVPKARVPIVRFRYRPYNLSCDVSFRNRMSVRNSRLIYIYTLMDPRVRQLMVVIRYWAKQQGITGRTSATGLNNYALTMLIIFSLQSVKPPLVLTVEKLQQLHVAERKEPVIIGGWDCSFSEDVQSITKNTMPFQRLLQKFFEFCSTFDFKTLVMCPFWGKTITKSDFRDTDILPENFKRYKENVSSGYCKSFQFESEMCVQDPFEQCFNLSRMVNAAGLELFQGKCSMAAEICRSSAEYKILQKLFTPTVCTGLTSDFKSLTSIPTFTVPLEGEDSIESATNIVTHVIETALKFCCRRVQDNSENPAKKNPDRRYIRCRADWEIWKKRDRRKAWIEIPPNTPFLETEGLVSEEIAQRESLGMPPSVPQSDFLCELKQVGNEVTLTLSDISSRKKQFDAVSKFLRTHLPYMILKYREEGNQH